MSTEGLSKTNRRPLLVGALASDQYNELVKIDCDHHKARSWLVGALVLISVKTDYHLGPGTKTLGVRKVAFLKWFVTIASHRRNQSETCF